MRDIDLVNKIYDISKTLDGYMQVCYGKAAFPLLQPAQCFLGSAKLNTDELGNAVLDMFVKSFEWQRGRSNEVVDELNEFKAMLKDSGSELSEQILCHLGTSWHNFNSENQAEVYNLRCYFAETLPAALYWWMSGMTEDFFKQLVEENQTK